MTLQLGSHGPLVSRWTDVMRRFQSYALGVDGQPIKNDGYFGYTALVRFGQRLRVTRWPQG